ncbi:leucine-rich repeat domain-containing protein [Bacillus haimaensis]|uniref:leucine-rich repeat domain-containing protein n=1 Tax=Bacillus haimaensis TaxID=3160967 RepID=UPI003AA9329E
MKKYFWLNLGVVFTLLLSLLSPALATAEVTEEQTGVILTKAVQTENGVSLEWETASNEDLTSTKQSFTLVKNGHSEIITPEKSEEQSTETKQVYTFIDGIDEVNEGIEYQVIWNIDNVNVHSNPLSVVHETQIEEEPSGTEEESEEEETEPVTKKEAALQEDSEEIIDESFLEIEKMLVNENSFTVTWYGHVEDSKGRLAKYELYMDGTLVKSGGINFAEYQFTKLQANTTYDVTVKALNSSNEVLLEKSIEVTTFPAPTGKIASFADKNLVQAIKDQLGVTRDIYESDVQNLTVLYAADYGIKSISGLEKAVNLEAAHLFYNEISDLTPLTNLTHLVELDLEGNTFTNIAPLKGLTNLSILWLSDNEISDIQDLSDLRKLEYLYLDRTNISNIDTLLLLPNLTHVTLSETDIDLTEGAPAWEVLNVWKEAGVYVDILEEVMEPYFEAYAEGTSEESVFLTWYHYFHDEEEDSYPENYKYIVYVNGEKYTETNESYLLFTDLEVETEYEFKVEMYSEAGEFLFDATTTASTLGLPTGDIVTIADEGLEEAIRQNLYLPDREIYQSDMERLQYLYAAYMNIEDLSGLEYATNLMMLDVEENSIVDITALKDLTLLTYLNLANNPIEDIYVLESLSGLEFLNLHGTPVTDISVLLTLEYLYQVTLFEMSNLTFEEETPELEVVEELLNRGVEVYLNEEDYIGVSPITINVLDVTENSIEIDWMYEGEEEVAYYEVIVNQEVVGTVEEGYYHITDLLSDSSYDITVVAFDGDGFLLGQSEISVTTLAENVEEDDTEETPGETDPKEEDKTPEDKPVDDTKEEETTEKSSGKGNKLPVTATNTMNFVLVGLALLFVGISGMVFAKRKRLA